MPFGGPILSRVLHAVTDHHESRVGAGVFEGNFRAVGSLLLAYISVPTSRPVLLPGRASRNTS